MASIQAVKSKAEGTEEPSNEDSDGEGHAHQALNQHLGGHWPRRMSRQKAGTMAPVDGESMVRTQMPECA